MAVAKPESTQMTKGHHTLVERYEVVRTRIAEAAKRGGRRGEEIVLVAVTKTATMDQIRRLHELGHVDFGESRVQHLVQRAAQVEEYLTRKRELTPEDEAHQRGQESGNREPRVRWHMIGHLQRNKARRIVPIVRLVHSVDSLRLAEELQAAATRREEPVEVLVQINTSGEKSKHGVAPAAARHLVEQIESMLTLRARGLMCMAPLVEDPNNARPTFERCREIYEDVRRAGAATDRFNILSMGMSNDYEVAIECGANIVRVGTAIFGDGGEETEAGTDATA